MKAVRVDAHTGDGRSHVHVRWHAQYSLSHSPTAHTSFCQDVLANVLKPLKVMVNEVTAFCEKRRGHKMFNHLMTIKEGIGCAGWVTVAPKPGPYVKEMHDQALFYGNRVIKEFKGKDE